MSGRMLDGRIVVRTVINGLERGKTDECYANKFEYVHVFIEINKLKRIISELLHNECPYFNF